VIDWAQVIGANGRPRAVSMERCKMDFGD
jgi:hypothetical protein